MSNNPNLTRHEGAGALDMIFDCFGTIGYNSLQRVLERRFVESAIEFLTLPHAVELNAPTTSERVDSI